MAVEAVHRLSLDQYHGMIEAGLLDEDARVEFIEGVIVDMSPKGEPHELTIVWLNKAFSRGVDLDRYDIRIGSPLTIGDSEPEPDVVVVEAGLQLPHPATAPLVIEVAWSSQQRDLVVKPPIYASAGIPDYWVVDLDGRRVVVHREPGPAGYASIEPVTSGALVAMGVTIDVAALLAAGA